MNNPEVSNKSINETDNSHQPNNLINMDTLLINLKNEDARNLRTMKSFKWMLFILVIFYSLLMVVNPDPDLKLHHRLSGLCYVASFAYFTLLFRKYYKMYHNIDYSLPTAEMYKKAAERYNLKFVHFLIVLPPVLLLDLGLSISEYYRLTSIDPVNRILIIQAIFIPIMILSGFIGYLIWRKKQKPLRDGALQILKDLNE